MCILAPYNFLINLAVESLYKQLSMMIIFLWFILSILKASLYFYQDWIYKIQVNSSSRSVLNSDEAKYFFFFCELDLTNHKW